jgi:hypothetical protein
MAAGAKVREGLMAWLIGSLPQVGGTAYIRTSDGSIVSGTYNGTGAGVSVGSKTYY